MKNTNTTGNVILTATHGNARVYLNRKGILKIVDGSEVEHAARFDSYEDAGKVARRKRRTAPVWAGVWGTLKPELLYMGVA